MRQGTLVTPPQEEPVDFPTLKLALRVTIDDDDALIASYLIAARDFVEDAYERALVSQTWDHSLPTFPWAGQSITLPIWPLQSVTSVTYIDSNNNSTVWPSTNYFVDTVSTPGRVVLAYGQGWPSVTLRTANAVVIRYVAGYSTPALVPWKTKTAIMMLVEHWYENREPIAIGQNVKIAEIPFAVRALLGASELPGVA